MTDFRLMRRLMRQVPRALADYNRIMSVAVGGTAQLTNMPRASGYSADRLPNAVIKLEDIEEAYHEILQQLTAMRTELKPYIDQLDDANDKAVMRLRYMYGYEVEEMGGENGVYMSRATVWRHLRNGEQLVMMMQK